MTGWNSDLTEVITPGAEIRSYMKIRTFMMGLSESDPKAQEFFKALNLVARVFKKVGGTDEGI